MQRRDPIQILHRQANPLEYNLAVQYYLCYHDSTRARFTVNYGESIQTGLKSGQCSELNLKSIHNLKVEP